MDNTLPNDVQTPVNTPNVPSSPEGLPVSEPKETVETIGFGAEQEKTPEKPQPEQPVEDVLTEAPVVDSTPVKNVVDKRGTEELDPVDENASPQHKDADKEEGDFIEHVEEVHSIV